MNDIYKRTLRFGLTIAGILILSGLVVRFFVVVCPLLVFFIPDIEWGLSLLSQLRIGITVLISISLTAQAGVITLKKHTDNKDLKMLLYSIDSFRNELDRMEERLKVEKDKDKILQIRIRHEKFGKHEKDYMNILLGKVDGKFKKELLIAQKIET